MGDTFSKYQGRFDPRIYNAIKSIPLPPKEKDTRPRDVQLKDFENQVRVLNNFGEVPPESDPGVLHTIKGIDGNSFNVKVFRPPPSKVENPKKIPTIVYFHGGGMAILTMQDYNTLYRIISTYGLLVIGVDFRNSIEKPFPAGLHDCLSAVLWTAEHAKEFNIDMDRLVVGGESGGGNLAAATCLLAKSRGISIIKGQFLHCPYLSPDFRYESRHKYGNSKDAGNMAQSYTNPQQYNNYLAWPCNATVEQLRGLPPTLMIVSEFDELVDEGEEYAGKLMQAGVRVVGLRSLGTAHCALQIVDLVPDLANMTFEILAAWVRSLGQKSKL